MILSFGAAKSFGAETAIYAIWAARGLQKVVFLKTYLANWQSLNLGGP